MWSEPRFILFAANADQVISWIGLPVIVIAVVVFVVIVGYFINLLNTS